MPDGCLARLQNGSLQELLRVTPLSVIALEGCTCSFAGFSFINLATNYQLSNQLQKDTDRDSEANSDDRTYTYNNKNIQIWLMIRSYSSREI